MNYTLREGVHFKVKESIKAYRNILFSYLFKLMPISNDFIYFCSYHGQYGDSPKYASELLYQMYPNSVFIWEISEKNKEEIPSYIKKVTPNSVKAIFYRSRSRITIDNYLGWSYGYADHLKYAFLAHQKRKKQYTICFWHGTPVKKIINDVAGRQKYQGMKFYTSADVLVCGNQYTANILKRQSQNKLPVLMYGAPRNDILLSEIDREKILEKLQLPNKKIVLYAPTFRDEVVWSGIKQLSDLNIIELLNQLDDKFGGEFSFVFRAHDSVLESREFKELNELKEDIILSGNIGDDMAEYLAVTDVLITDYSSSMFDFLLSGRPCFLYCPDIEHYDTSERGFYISLDKLPFPLAIKKDDLINSITKFDKEQYQSDVNDFLTFLGNQDIGVATEKVIAKISEILVN